MSIKNVRTITTVGEHPKSDVNNSNVNNSDIDNLGFDLDMVAIHPDYPDQKVQIGKEM